MQAIELFVLLDGPRLGLNEDRPVQPVDDEVGASVALDLLVLDPDRRGGSADDPQLLEDGLLRSIPRPASATAEPDYIELTGELPSAADPPNGARFRPSGGSDIAGVLTSATRDGDCYVINGQKVWSTGAHLSDFGLCPVRTRWDVPKHKGISVFIVI